MDLLDIVIAKQLSGGGGGSGTDNYNDLSNLPKINDTTLSGNKSSSALGLQSEINSDSKLASDLVDDTNQDNKFVTSTEKNTWNAKQNAIDVDHKLSSSLVSFTDAEAAALASGIDSSKVGQISTNQTNILYALQTGVKNLCPLDTLTTSGGETNHADVDLPAGTYHIYCTTTASTYSVVLKDANNQNLYYHDHSGSPLSIDVTITGTAKTFYIWNSSAATFSDVMICPKVAWDAEPNVFRPYALPNYDLTQLEAEDRAALVDVVDSGAKNLLDWANSEIATYNPYHATVSKTESSFTITSTDISAAYGFVMSLPKGEYVLTTTISNFSGSNSCWCTISVGSRSGNIVSEYTFTGNCNIELRFDLTQTSDVYINYYAHKTGTSYADTTSFTASNLMICTLAEWKVSKNFVSYALPNTDLTVLEAEDRAALAEEIDAGAKNLFEFPSLSTLKANNSLGTWNNNEYTFNGVTFTVNTEDKTVSTTGTANAYAFFELQRYSTSTAKYSGDVLSGCPYGGNFDNGYFVYAVDGQGTTQCKDIGAGGVLNNVAIRSILIGCRSGVSISGLTFKPMVCTKAAFCVSNKFVPYRPSYDDLVNRKPKTVYAGPSQTVVNYSIEYGTGYKIIVQSADGYTEATAYRTSGNVVLATLANTFSSNPITASSDHITISPTNWVVITIIQTF